MDDMSILTEFQEENDPRKRASAIPLPEVAPPASASGVRPPEQALEPEVQEPTIPTDDSLLSLSGSPIPLGQDITTPPDLLSGDYVPDVPEPEPTVDLTPSSMEVLGGGMPSLPGEIPAGTGRSVDYQESGQSVQTPGGARVEEAARQIEANRQAGLQKPFESMYVDGSQFESIYAADDSSKSQYEDRSAQWFSNTAPTNIERSSDFTRRVGQIPGIAKVGDPQLFSPDGVIQNPFGSPEVVNDTRNLYQKGLDAIFSAVGGNYRQGDKPEFDPFRGYKKFAEEVSSNPLNLWKAPFILPIAAGSARYGEMGDGYIGSLLYGASLIGNGLVGTAQSLYNIGSGNIQREVDNPTLKRVLQGDDLSFTNENSPNKPLAILGKKQSPNTLNEATRRSWIYNTPLAQLGSAIMRTVTGKTGDERIPENLKIGTDQWGNSWLRYPEFAAGLALDIATPSLPDEVTGWFRPGTRLPGAPPPPSSVSPVGEVEFLNPKAAGLSEAPAPLPPSANMMPPAEWWNLSAKKSTTATPQTTEVAPRAYVPPLVTVEAPKIKPPPFYTPEPLGPYLKEIPGYVPFAPLKPDEIAKKVVETGGVVDPQAVRQVSRSNAELTMLAIANGDALPQSGILTQRRLDLLAESNPLYSRVGIPVPDEIKKASFATPLAPYSKTPKPLDLPEAAPVNALSDAQPLKPYTPNQPKFPQAPPDAQPLKPYTPKPPREPQPLNPIGLPKLRQVDPALRSRVLDMPMSAPYSRWDSAQTYSPRNAAEGNAVGVPSNIRPLLPNKVQGDLHQLDLKPVGEAVPDKKFTEKEINLFGSLSSKDVNERAASLFKNSNVVKSDNFNVLIPKGDALDPSLEEALTVVQESLKNAGLKLPEMDLVIVSSGDTTKLTDSYLEHLRKLYDAEDADFKSTWTFEESLDQVGGYTPRTNLINIPKSADDVQELAATIIHEAVHRIDFEADDDLVKALEGFLDEMETTGRFPSDYAESMAGDRAEYLAEALSQYLSYSDVYAARMGSSAAESTKKLVSYISTKFDTVSEGVQRLVEAVDAGDIQAVDEIAQKLTSPPNVVENPKALQEVNERLPLELQVEEPANAQYMQDYLDATQAALEQSEVAAELDGILRAQKEVLIKHLDNIEEAGNQAGRASIDVPIEFTPKETAKTVTPQSTAKPRFYTVDVSSIEPPTTPSRLSPEELEVRAQDLLSNGIQNPLVLQRTGGESFEVFKGYEDDYYIAARAKQINPRSAEMVDSFVFESSTRVEGAGLDAQAGIPKIELEGAKGKGDFYMVDVDSIKDIPDGSYTKTQIEQVAQSILDSTLLRPVRLIKGKADSYSVAPGDELLYLGAKRARQIDPRKGEMVNSYVLKKETAPKKLGSVESKVPDVKPPESAKQIEQTEAPRLTGVVPGKLFHGSKVRNLDLKNIDPIQGGSRGELGVGLYLTNNIDYATDYAKATPAGNLPPVPGREFDELGTVHDVQISLRSTYRADGSGGFMYDLRQEMITAVENSLFDADTKKAISKLFNSSKNYETVLNEIDKIVLKNYGEIPENLLLDLQRRLSTVFRNNGYDAIVKSTPKGDVFNFIADPRKINSFKTEPLEKTGVGDLLEGAIHRYNADQRSAQYFPKSAYAKDNATKSAGNLVYHAAQEMQNMFDDAQEAAVRLADIAHDKEKMLKKIAAQEKANRKAQKLVQARKKDELMVKHNNVIDDNPCL